ncbi:MAG: NAD(P)H-hydrate epimerase, partial [Mesorhizobium sp.]
MAHEIFTPDEMAAIDRRAIEAGPFDGYRLMRNAGAAVAREALARHGEAAMFDVLAGPGNNGGDGYVIATLLAQAGASVRLFAHGVPRTGSDAPLAAADCPVETLPFAGYRPERGAAIIDALYGAGLNRALGSEFADVFGEIERLRLPVIAVDLPSGLNGLTGQATGPVMKADLTVTFVRKKPGHLLYPGRALCGEFVVADIGVREAHVGPSALRENLPDNWRASMPVTQVEAHKYQRGHVTVFSGGPTATGAARLAAMGAARSGAGAVTVLS